MTDRIGKSTTTTLAHPDHFQVAKFTADGRAVTGKKVGKPRKIRPLQRARIYVLQLEIRAAQAQVNMILDQAGIDLTSRSHHTHRIWIEKGK